MSDLAADIEALLGEAVSEVRPLGGGDVADAYRAQLATGALVFAKSQRGPSGALGCEAEGLNWLREADALRIPQVLGVRDGSDSPRSLLVLEWIESGPRGPRFDERLGRGLAALHASGAPAFGLAGDNFLAALPQPNEACASWAEFYAQRRLEPMLRRARDAGLASSDLLRRFDGLLARLPERVGPQEPPARLHGDLWGGNALCNQHDEPVLIDAAVYGGHREIDLAMMRLFGGFAERSFAAYHEVHPLAPGSRERVPLYQLYPLLVHLNLFGRSYLGTLESALADCE